MAKRLFDKAFELVDRTQISEAKCVLQIAFELNQDEEGGTDANEEVIVSEEELQEHITKMGNELMAQLEDQLEYSEDQRQEQVEAKISSIENEIAYAEQQATMAKSEEEVRMIREQMEAMVKEVGNLK
jgi:hypothetical protein